MASKSKRQRFSREDESEPKAARDFKAGNEADFKPKPKKGLLEPNVFAYYQRCNQVLNKENQFESENDKIAFLKATFETLASDGFKVFQNQTLSRVIESFLDNADFEILCTVLKIFAKNWETSVTDRFAHRVLQKTLEVYQTLLNASAEAVELGNPPEFLQEVVLKVTDFGAHMYENYPHYMDNPQASFILRAYLKVLAGLKVKVVGSKEEIELLTPGLSNFEFVLNDLTKSLLYSPHLKETISQPLPNLFIQTILTCIRYRFPKQMRQVVRHFLQESDLLKEEDQTIRQMSNVSIPAIFTNHQGCYFMERLVRLMSEKLFRTFVDTFIIDKVEVLALNACAGFVLQRVIERADKELFDRLIPALCQKLPDAFAEKQIGLIQALAVAAEQFPESQRRLVSAIRKCLRCNGDDPVAQAAFLGCLTKMTAFGVIPEKPEDAAEGSSKGPQLNYHGCLIAQSILRYKKTGFIVRSIQKASAEELLQIGCDRMGNHVLEAFFNSPTISNEFKMSGIQQMDAVLPSLACNKFGSRVMDCMWKHLDADGRSYLVQKLMPFKNKLRNDRFGFFVCRNFGMMIYHRKREWMQMQTESTSKTSGTGS